MLEKKCQENITVSGWLHSEHTKLLCGFISRCLPHITALIQQQNCLNFPSEEPFVWTRGCMFWGITVVGFIRYLGCLPRDGWTMNFRKQFFYLHVLALYCFKWLILSYYISIWMCYTCKWKKINVWIDLFFCYWLISAHNWLLAIMPRFLDFILYALLDEKITNYPLPPSSQQQSENSSIFFFRIPKSSLTQL